MTSTVPQILIIASGTNSVQLENNGRFVDKLNGILADEAEVRLITYRDICIEFETGKLQVSTLPDMKPLSQFSFIYIKSYSGHSEQALTIAQYLQATGTSFVCSELRDGPSASKLTQFAKMSLAEVPIIKTIYVDRSHVVDSYDRFVGALGLPLIVKAIDGSKGNHNYLVHDRKELESALVRSPDMQFVIQKYIENDGDIRVLIVGEQIGLLIERKRAGGTHLNNTSKGANARLMDADEITDEQKAFSLKAAHVMRKESAGVDLMIESGTGAGYIMEVNGDPQITTGAYSEEKLQVYSNYFRNMLKYINHD